MVTLMPRGANTPAVCMGMVSLHDAPLAGRWEAPHKRQGCAWWRCRARSAASSVDRCSRTARPTQAARADRRPRRSRRLLPQVRRGAGGPAEGAAGGRCCLLGVKLDYFILHSAVFRCLLRRSWRLITSFLPHPACGSAWVFNAAGNELDTRQYAACPSWRGMPRWLLLKSPPLPAAAARQDKGCDAKIASGGGRMGVTMDRCECCAWGGGAWLVHLFAGWPVCMHSGRRPQLRAGSVPPARAAPGWPPKAAWLGAR